MELHNIYHHESGFTLLEVLIVLFLISVLSTAAINISLSVMQRSFFNSDIESIISLVQSARSQSLNNENGKAHGIRIEDGKTILFSGDYYDPSTNSNIITETTVYPVSHNAYEITFTPFTGHPANSVSINLADGHNTATISINANGVIND